MENPGYNVFAGRKGLRAGWRLLIFFALIVVEMTVVVGLLRVFHVALPHKGGGFSAASPWLIALGEGCLFVLVLLPALVMAKCEGRRFGAYGLPWRSAFGARFWGGALTGFVALSAVLAVIAATGGVRIASVSSFTPALVSALFGFAAAFLMVGFFEEFSMRGYVQYTLASGIYFWPAALVTSAAFAMAHLSNPGESVDGLLQVFLFGIVFCFVLQRTGNLWFGIGFHMAWDWGQTFFYGVPDSGIVASTSLLHTVLSGPAWLAGGTVGPEGSAFTPAALLGTALFVAWRFRGNRYASADAAATSPAVSATA